MKNKLNFALIGCGRISGKHVEAIANNQEYAELVAVSDLVSDRMSRAVEKYQSLLPNKKLKCYTDYTEMLCKEDIDVVCIATESGFHPEIAIRCLSSGKHVIVEKPMALSILDADKMITKAKDLGLKLCVCHQNRFNPPIQKLRNALDEGRFGKLLYGVASIRWNRNEDYYLQAPWRGTWELDGGTLMNQCIHNIDLLQWMMGPIAHIYAETDRFLRNIEAEDTGIAVIRFENGALGIIEGTACIYPKNLEETLNIFGEAGTVCIGGLAVNKIETWRFAEETEDNLNLGSQKDPDSVYGFGHTPFIKDMIDAINSNREPLINGEEGKKALEIVLAIYKSSRTKAPVKLPLENYSTLSDLEERIL